MASSEGSKMTAANMPWAASVAISSTCGLIASSTSLRGDGVRACSCVRILPRFTDCLHANDLSRLSGYPDLLASKRSPHCAPFAYHPPRGPDCRHPRSGPHHCRAELFEEDSATERFNLCLLLGGRSHAERTCSGGVRRRGSAQL
jgi:hypothetical protein